MLIAKRPIAYSIYDIVCLYNHLPVIGFVRVSIAAISHITLKWCVTRPTTWRLAARAHACVHLCICVHVCMYNYVCIKHVYVYNHSHIFFNSTHPLYVHYRMGSIPPPSHAIERTILIHSIHTSCEWRVLLFTQPIRHTCIIGSGLFLHLPKV